MIFFWLCFCCCFFCWMNLLGLFVWLVLLLQFLEPWNSWRLRFGGKAKVLACSSSSKRYVLSGCLRKEQQLGWIFDLLGGGFKCFFYFHPYLGKSSNLTHIFSNGLKPPSCIDLYPGPRVLQHFDRISFFRFFEDIFVETWNTHWNIWNVYLIFAQSRNLQLLVTSVAT